MVHFASGHNAPIARLVAGAVLTRADGRVRGVDAGVVLLFHESIVPRRCAPVKNRLGAILGAG